MRALVTNDDGVDAHGIRVLARAAVAAGLEVVVAAPHQERSGSGTGLSALAEGGRLIVEPRTWDDVPGAEVLSVEASPAMIAFVGGHGAFGPVPDVVLSGVNHGANAGQAVLHSGTVGAALTAASIGIPALAVSMKHVRPAHWETADHATGPALKWFLANLTQPYVLNVNVPDVPLADYRGLREATMATFGAVQARVGERGEGYVTMSFEQIDEAPDPDSDVALLASGWATATALLPPFPTAEVDLSGL